MSMTTCPECGKPVSDHAKICPHCGINRLNIDLGTSCSECGGSISNNARVCPHCGANWPVPGDSKQLIILILLLFAFLFILKLLSRYL
ncbi:MAG: zinc ribbon domain-containing protein [Desulfovibrio sp.]|jgi:RNA polymerase subunit RPABC4/transcription elongation factor Spt4|nr:zinc ribbon domain-containing protein [Desulfovibrio sp.]